MRLARITQLELTVSGGEATLNGTLPGAGAIVVLLITGPGVSTRTVSEQDPILKRVMVNPDILYTTYPDRVCYVPKGPVTELTASWKDIPVAGIIVSDGMADTASAISVIERNIPSTMMAGQWYERLKLPVLLVYLAILLANFLATPSLGRKYDERRRQLDAAERQNRTETEVSEKQKRLMTEFLQISSDDSAYSFDKIASCVPEKVRLTQTSLEADLFIIKGETVEASSVVAFTNRLGDYFPSTKIQSFDKIPGRETSAFEIRVSR